MTQYKETNIFRKLKSKIKTYPVFGFDIETYGPENKFLLGSIVGKGYHETFYDEQEMVNSMYRLSGKNKTIIMSATNLEFDLYGIIPKTKEYIDFIPLRSGSRTIGGILYRPYLRERNGKIIVEKQYKVKLMDSLSFFPVSVKRLGEIMGIMKLPTPQYILEKRRPYDYEMGYIEKYNLVDSLITYKFMEWLQKNYNDRNTEIKYTVASSSLNMYRRNYLNRDWYKGTPEAREIVLKSYYGGRTEVFRRGTVKNFNVYDINSLYPSCMYESVYPDVNYEKIAKNPKISFIERFEGVSHVKVYCPNHLNIPLLPFHDKAGKLIFPIGIFEGFYTHVELRKALELGYKILDIYQTVYYTQVFRPFKAFIKERYNQRLKYKKLKDPREIIEKLSMNSLYGKFGQKANHDKIVHIDNPTIDIQKIINSNQRFMIINDFIYIKDEDSNKPLPCFSFPILSSYSTSLARIKMFDLLNSCENPIYCDTDSIFTTDKLPTSDKLGALKLEYSANEGIFIRPKFYAYEDKMTCKIKIKGVTNRRIDTMEGFKQIINKQKVKFTRFSKFKESNNRGLAYNQVIEQIKELDIEDNKRIWENEKFTFKEQKSRPIRIVEGLTEEEYRKTQDKVRIDYEKYKEKEMEDYFNSDLFDSDSVGNDINNKEFLENEIFFELND